MFTLAAVVALALGAGSLVVVVVGIRNGHFPFRPRGSGAGPDGDRHTVRRSEEPFTFWFAAGGLIVFGVMLLALAGVLTVRLFRGGP